MIILYFLIHLFAPAFSSSQTVIENIIHDRLKELFPSDAATYFENKFTCSHWMGEDGGSDEARSSTINDGIKDSCSQLEKSKSRILTKYKKDKSLIANFKRADAESNSCGYEEECDFIFDDPKLTSKVLSNYYQVMAEVLIKEFSSDFYKNKKSADGVKTDEFNQAQTFISNRGGYFAKVTKNKKRLPKTTLDKYDSLTSSLKNAGHDL